MSSKESVPLANDSSGGSVEENTSMESSNMREDLASSARSVLACAVNYLHDIVQSDGHWVGELRSNPTVTAEYVFLYQAAGLKLSDESADGLRQWFLSIQKDDGSWGIAPDYPGDVSTTTEVYLALKILGLTIEDLVMTRAQDFMYLYGGIARVRVFTRIYLATFGLFPWDEVPEMPAELILMPSQAPVNLYKFSSWARSTITPLLIICHHRPIYALPNGLTAKNDYLDELWYVSPLYSVFRPAPSLWDIWNTDWVALFFMAMDKVLYLAGGLRSSPTRAYARRKCIKWILEHQESSGDWAGIFPPMHIGILALLLEGHSVTDDPVRLGLEAIERFAWSDKDGKRMQACVSPVWDTALSTISLCDARMSSHPGIKLATSWLQHQQITGPEGDWRIYSPQITAGGFCFEYFNKWYPDVDDTAAVILAFLKADPQSACMTHVLRAVEWVLGMQNHDGGWAAFDKDNDMLFLNKIPFSDMNSLCDPSTADVTGRVLEAFGLMLLHGHFEKDPTSLGLRDRLTAAADKGIGFLEVDQMRNGSWYGRWGVNYVYGTSNVLCGLMYFLHKPRVRILGRSAVRWLRGVQNDDGGWGECLESYSKPELAGTGVSTASQTAWGLMGMLAGEGVSSQDESVVKGVRWLIDHRKSRGSRRHTEDNAPGQEMETWDQVAYTGTGFPEHFYLNYDLYRHYFPVMALGRFVQQSDGGN